ncbi:MAG: hypothetical protein HY909_07740 [Deltaproteobacteria bacterium]|nr:hypothetical protein [Deltaproteobacteria bacterium]
MKRARRVVWAVAAWALGATAEARPVHHQGFYTRLALGAGYLSSTETTSFGDVSVTGGGLALQVALGGYVAPGLALHGTLRGTVALDPAVRFGTTTAVVTNGSLQSSAVGVGVTYTFVPVDFYLSASLGVGVLRVERALSGSFSSVRVEAQTELGLALDFGLGKQWAVSDDWALGVSGMLFYQRNSERASSSSSATFPIDSLGVAVLFSATYH